MRCGNAACGIEAKYFRDGSLHCIDCGNPDGPDRSYRRQVIWLCPQCSEELTVETWRPPGEQIRPRRLPLCGTSPNPCLAA